MEHRYWGYTGAALLLAVLLIGCGGGPKAVSALSVTLNGATNMNSLEGQPANSAIVRVYQLTNATNFRDVTLERFWQDDKAALGAELAAEPQQILLYPGQDEYLAIDPVEGARYIGIAADLRQPDREGWREAILVEEMRGRRVLIRVVQDRLVVDLR